MKIRQIFEADGDESELAPDKIEALMHELQELSKDTSAEYSNALEMVHKAYRICGIDRPSPSMRGAWDQYEKCMTAAVQYLGKNNPTGNWRFTSVTPKSPNL